MRTVSAYADAAEVPSFWEFTALIYMGLSLRLIKEASTEVAPDIYESDMRTGGDCGSESHT